MRRSALKRCHKKDTTTKTCSVCDDSINKKTNGLYSCSSCIKFFARTVQNNLTYFCEKKKICPVKKHHHNFCKFCRYQKCLKSGMKRQSVQQKECPKVHTITDQRQCPKVPTTTDQRQCHICCCPANGKYYGSILWSCDNCRNFFRRAVVSNAKYSCKVNKKCSIKLKRNFCKYCRFKKCLAAGMKKEAVNRKIENSTNTEMKQKTFNRSRNSSISELEAEDIDSNISILQYLGIWPKDSIPLNCSRNFDCADFNPLRDEVEFKPLLDKDHNSNLCTLLSDVKNEEIQAAFTSHTNSINSHNIEIKLPDKYSNTSAFYGMTIMNQAKVTATAVQNLSLWHLCLICGNPTNEKYYGVYSCKCCALFFRQAILENLTFACKKYRKCLIANKYPKKCSYCHYQKCLASGMKVETIEKPQHSLKRSNSTSQHSLKSFNSTSQDSVKICLICKGVSDASRFYKRYSCESCRKFFRRTVLLDLTYTCENDKKCIIDKCQRCKFCRYEKCLSLGMKRDSVLV